MNACLVKIAYECQQCLCQANNRGLIVYRAILRMVCKDLACFLAFRVVTLCIEYAKLDWMKRLHFFCRAHVGTVERRAFLAHDDRFRSSQSEAVSFCCSFWWQARAVANACPGKGIVLCRSTAIQQMNVKHAFVWSARYHASMQKLTSCHLLSLQLSVCHMTWIGICEYCFDKLQSVQPKTSSPSSSSGTASSCKAMASISAVKVSSGRKPRAL